MADLMRSTSNNDNEGKQKMRESLSGKTGEEIISYAQQVTAEREMKLKKR